MNSGLLVDYLHIMPGTARVKAGLVNSGRISVRLEMPCSVAKSFASLVTLASHQSRIYTWRFTALKIQKVLRYPSALTVSFRWLDAGIHHAARRVPCVLHLIRGEVPPEKGARARHSALDPSERLTEPRSDSVMLSRSSVVKSSTPSTALRATEADSEAQLARCAAMEVS